MKKHQPDIVACALILTFAASLATAADTPSTSAGHSFPTRPIRLISPFAPGGGNDIMSRTLGAALTKGLGPGIVDLVAGRLQAIFSTTPSAMPHIKSGRLRALAVTSATRSNLTPQLPTVAESGIPGYDASTWYGIIAPAGTPHAVIARLNREMTTLLAALDFREQLMAAGADPAPNTPEQFAALIQSEISKWAKVIKISGARAESQ